MSFNDYGLNPYDDPRDPVQYDHDTRDDADHHDEVDEWAWLHDAITAHNNPRSERPTDDDDVPPMGNIGAERNGHP